MLSRMLGPNIHNTVQPLFIDKEWLVKIWLFDNSLGINKKSVFCDKWGSSILIYTMFEDYIKFSNCPFVKFSNYPNLWF